MTARRFLVLGCGSIGMRHARNLLELGQHVFAYDPGAAQRERVGRELGIETFDDLEAAWGSLPEAAVIATPTSSHLELALESASRGCHFFVEKPLSNSLERVPELLAAVAERQLVTLVGCNMRFHPGVQALKNVVERQTLGTIFTARFEAGQYLPDWRPGTDYRQSYSAQRALGGGIVLDAIHELDYASWLLGEVTEVACFADHVSELEIDTEDVASILLRFGSSAIAAVHLDYLQRAYSRSCALVGERGTARWDYTKPDLEVFLADEGRWTTTQLFEEWDANSMYFEELRHFIRCLDGVDRPLADATTGSRVLAVALAAKRAAADRVVVTPADMTPGGGA